MQISKYKNVIRIQKAEDVKVILETCSPLVHIQRVFHPEHFITIYAHGCTQPIMRIDIVGSRTVRTVSDSFRQRKYPHSPGTLNFNENRNHNNILGSLRSPLPAAKRQRTSTVQRTVRSCCYSDLPDVFFSVLCIACSNAQSRNTVGAEGRFGYTHHFWCRCVIASSTNTKQLR